ncbi:hypothetical protein A4J19_27090 [Salmonella enterica subsp. enterica serovar Oranienburg]|uniref:Uncharacterized protein n=1 Tax=Salmonella enterica I TaxID=59201 RepID=A0A403MPV6_SALET|nr:hypothetical protein [Salmonella enterica subsp. enterica serovar Oranienburg]MLV00315.1 hypothetical protein [Salmonella enterica subsp. enterica serovar Oranienburg]
MCFSFPQMKIISCILLHFATMQQLAAVCILLTVLNKLLNETLLFYNTARRFLPSFSDGHFLFIQFSVCYGRCYCFTVYG